MGQVNLVLVGREFIADGGSFTLTSGVLTHDPIRFGSSASMVNGAIDGVRARGRDRAAARPAHQRGEPGRAASKSMPGYGPFFRGHEPVPGARVGAGLRQERRGCAHRAGVRGALTARAGQRPIAVPENSRAARPAPRPRCGAGRAASRAGRRTAPPARPGRAPGRASRTRRQLGLARGHGGGTGRAREAQHGQRPRRHLDDPDPAGRWAPAASPACSSPA